MLGYYFSRCSPGFMGIHGDSWGLGIPPSLILRGFFPMQRRRAYGWRLGPLALVVAASAIVWLRGVSTSLATSLHRPGAEGARRSLAKMHTPLLFFSYFFFFLLLSLPFCRFVPPLLTLARAK